VLERFTLQEIKQGFSPDKKYIATDKQGQKFFLRVEKNENRELFDFQADLFERGIKVAKPLGFERVGDEFWSLYEWIDGDTGNNCLGNYEADTQYHLGFLLGQEIKKLHSLPSKSEMVWCDFFQKSALEVIEKFEAMNLDFAGKDLLIATIRENLQLVKDRPVTYLHGDLSDGNVMVTTAGDIKIIDFIDDFGYGDPWKEFSKIINTAHNSTHFAMGQVDSYFDGQIPDEFWALLKLYSCYQGLEAVVWSAPLKHESLTNWLVMICEKVAAWYSDGTEIPTWYQPSHRQVQQVAKRPTFLSVSMERGS